jgi:hypothetical protein
MPFGMDRYFVRPFADQPQSIFGRHQFSVEVLAASSLG